MKKDRKSCPGWTLTILTCLAIGSVAEASAVEEYFGNIGSVVFVVDVTRLAGETPGDGSGVPAFAQMKTLLATALTKLSPDCRFSILANNGGGLVSLGTRTASEENVSGALEWIGGLSPVTEPDIFQAVAESGVPPYDECMNFVLITRGVVNPVYWETDMPTTTNILNLLPEGARFTSIKIPGIDHEFSSMFMALCEGLAQSTGGRVIVLD